MKTTLGPALPPQDTRSALPAIPPLPTPQRPLPFPASGGPAHPNLHAFDPRLRSSRLQPGRTNVNPAAQAVREHARGRHSV